MPYIIDSITAETINVNREILVDGKPISSGSYNNIGNSSVNTNIDWSNGVIQELNLDNNPTLTFTNGLTGQTSTLLLKQQLPGLRTITWPNNVVWNGGSSPTLQTLQSPQDPGEIDSSFNAAEFFSESPATIYSTYTQPDGKILVGGDFSILYNGFEISGIIRLNSDGSVDESFNTAAEFPGTNGFVYVITMQDDGKILIGGNFQTYNGDTANTIARLNFDGSLDNTFNSGDGVNGEIRTISVQSDGKILLGGIFSTYDGVISNYIVRINSDGTVDNTFNSGVGFDGETYSISNQIDGKIVVGGSFTTYNETFHNRIIRLNSDGTVDNSFDTGGEFGGVDGEVYTVAIQENGKILVGGIFSTYNGTESNNIVRINADGSIDDTFNTGTGFNDSVYSISIQSDGRIIAGGGFFEYNGLTSNFIVRINSDGSADNTFNDVIGYRGFDGVVYSTSIQYPASIFEDEKIMVGGEFTTYNENNAESVVRLIGNASTILLAYNTVEFDYNGTYYIGSY
jgi:uncharacterized delta-60 repeat protein